MVNFPLMKVIEGKTEIFVPDNNIFKNPYKESTLPKAPVFYNKVMELNRDFALAALRTFKKLTTSQKLLYCEPLAGTGIRSVRVANEISDINVVITDLNPDAVGLIRENIANLNLEYNTQVFNEDANVLMLRFSAQGNKFDIIDIDPFGSPAPFIDSVAQALNDNALLAVTSTDMATMCGVYQKACIRKYASKPIRSWIAHELAVRMLIGFIAITLARHEKCIQPVFAHSTEHYIRVYIITNKGISEAKESIDNLCFIAHCLNCFNIDNSIGIINTLQEECPICHSKRAIGGPFWLGKIYQNEFIANLEQEISSENSLYGTQKRMKKILNCIIDELKANRSPKAMICYYDLHQIADKLNIPSPKMGSIIFELISKGFIATKTHFRENSIKTDAPVEEIINAMKKALIK